MKLALPLSRGNEGSLLPDSKTRRPYEVLARLATPRGMISSERWTPFVAGCNNSLAPKTPNGTEAEVLE